MGVTGEDGCYPGMCVYFSMYVMSVKDGFTTLMQVLALCYIPLIEVHEMHAPQLGECNNFVSH